MGVVKITAGITAVINIIVTLESQAAKKRLDPEKMQEKEILKVATLAKHRRRGKNVQVIQINKIEHVTQLKY